MGEAFKRIRAASFKQQRSGPYQALVDANLLTLSRATTTSYGLSARLSNDGTGLTVGSTCLVMPAAAEGQYEVVYGNRVVATLPPEAIPIIHAIEKLAPALKGMVPCRVVRESGFGGVFLEVDSANDSHE